MFFARCVDVCRFFFFQAEDGIRDHCVTGVQTCALPILAEDCGPCTQLVVDMALESGMPKDQIEAVLRRDARAMNEATTLGFRFADAVVRRAADAEDEFRDAVRAEWG